MALAPNPVIGSSFVFQDNNGKTAITSLYLPPVGIVTLADGADYVQQLADAMIPLSNAGLTATSYSQGAFDEAIVAANLPPESEVERKLVFIFNTGNRYVKVRVEVPSPVFSVETAGTDEVNPANPLVAAFINAVVNGPVGFANGAVAAAGNQITGISRVFISHRGRGAPRR